MFGFLPGPCGCAGPGAQSAWRSHFCGLCNTLRARYGLWSRWLINRDSTFLALTGSAITATPPPVIRATCCNPLGKKKLLVQHEPQMRYAAAVTICALTVKLRDDAGDERGLRRTGARAGKWMLRRAEQKARMDLEATGFPLETVTRALGGQDAVETAGASLVEAAGPTARAYGAIFGHLPRVTGAPDSAILPLTEAGAALGRLIYTVDAWEDYEADRRRNRFNPLPAGENHRRDLVMEAVSRDLSLLSRVLGALPLFRHRSLMDSLSGVRLRQRTLERLGVENPPPLPPPELPPPDPIPPPLQSPGQPDDDPKPRGKSSRKRERKHVQRTSGNSWFCCPDLCCAGCERLCCCGGKPGRGNCCGSPSGCDCCQCGDACSACDGCDGCSNCDGCCSCDC